MRVFGPILAAALLAVAGGSVAAAAVILSPGDGTSLRTGIDAVRNRAASSAPR